MTASLGERLRTWAALRRVRPAPEEPNVQSGRDAEAELRRLVTSRPEHKGAHLFAGRRVWCPRRRLRREIDLILATPKLISLLEVKNWSGELRDRGDVWLHVRRNGQEVRHPNLVADNREKRDVFLDYLRRGGADLGRDFAARGVSHKIVFMNPNLAADASIRDHPDVVTADRLAGYLDHQPRAGLAERLLGSVVEFCLGPAAGGLFGGLGASRFAELVLLIADLPTWDRLRLHGGKELIGDLVELTAGGTRHRRDRLGHGAALRVSWSRGACWGLVKALTGLGTLGRLTLPAHGRVVLRAADTVRFHAVGETGAAVVPLTGVEEISLG